MLHYPSSHSLGRSLLILVVALLLPDLGGASPVPSDPGYALAYIDPGTGSFLIQAFVAAVAGIAVTSRLYWKKIKAFLGLTAEEDEEAGPSRDDG